VLFNNLYKSVVDLDGDKYLKSPSLKDKLVLDRVGSNIPTLTIACYDIYANREPFQDISALTVKLLAEKGLLFETNRVNMYSKQCMHGN